MLDAAGETRERTPHRRTYVRDLKGAHKGGAVPGGQKGVCLEGADDALQSPYRGGNILPEEAMAVGADLRPLVESQCIEFLELLTPDKFQE